ncbi:MAG: HAMP domain-containing protein [Deltaproteobacteria bacterium]|nr:HAMP domain-containing protein [Deltaproteobacteria bacterium]MBW2415141.1 HAMP domain-containing protein [Deltaproteobacteria bacterium]
MIVPLRLKLALLASVLLVAGIGTVSLLLLDRSSEALETEARKRGRYMASSLARNARDAVLLEDDLVLSGLLGTVATEDEVLTVRVLDPKGRVIASSPPSSPQDDPIPPARLTRGLDSDEPIALASPDGELLVASRISFNAVDLGEAQVVLDLHAIVGQVLARARRSVLIASGALLLVGIAIAFALSGRITRPLRRLHLAVKALAAGDTSSQVLVTTRDEVGVLTEAFNDMSRSLNEKGRIESAFRRYVSDHVLQQVVDRPASLQLRHLKGERRVVTLLFIDIRGFSALASTIGPEELVAYLNEAFELITSRLLEHGATVDQYLGDAILAYFGAPIEIADHAERAVASAIAIQRSVEERNIKCEASSLPSHRLDVGIGIQTGPVVLGNIGSELKMNYTAIGDAVNVANRLQAIAGPGQIMLTDDVRTRLAGRVELQDLGPQQVKGREEPVRVFQVTF